MVARDVVMEMVSQRGTRIKEVGVDGWLAELSEEAIQCLKQVGVAEDEARRDLELDLAEEENPQVFLETLVAEARTVQKLGKTSEVAEKMRQADTEEE